MCLFFMLSVVTSFTYFINCGALCSWTVDGNTIDLSDLSGSTLDGTDGSFDYYYTPCQDGLTCTKSTGEQYEAMSDMLNSAGNCAAYLAIWDAAVQPTYSDYNNKTFTFQYTNGETSATCTSTREFKVNWICDATITTPIVESVGEIGTCEYEMNILSSLACNGDHGGNCSWTTTNGYTLDLSQIDGVMIEYTNNITEYIYTPCRNGLTCMNQPNSIYGTSVDVMSMVLNENSFCQAYLAKWDKQVLPIYNTDQQSFAFEYRNGEIDDVCVNGRVLYVEWICDDNAQTNQLFKVETAGEVISCVYEIIIKSKLVCTNSLKYRKL